MYGHAGDPRQRLRDQPADRGSSSANNNLVSQNMLSGNGQNPPPIVAFPGVDITLLRSSSRGRAGNCFEKNKPTGFTFFSSEPDGQLPTDGAGRCPTDWCREAGRVRPASDAGRSTLPTSGPRWFTAR